MQHLIINNVQAKQRIDKFLTTHDQSISRSTWQKKIIRHEVLVNNQPTTAHYILKLADRITIAPTKIIPNHKALVTIPILYEDQNVIALDKPAGIITHNANSSTASSVEDFLKNYYPAIQQVGELEQKNGIVHRLDKDTSGILLVAKNNDTFLWLKQQFKNRQVQKIYTALVHGLTNKQQTIDFPIARSKSNPQKQVAIKHLKQQHLKARTALTTFQTLRHFPQHSLISVNLQTGRMHQIRVHMKAIGHPIVGDPKYSSSKLADNLSLTRQFLHATSLTITLPNLESKTFHSALPTDLQVILQNLSKLTET